MTRVCWFRLNAKLAWLLAHSGRAEKVLPLAQRAVEVVPWRTQYLMTLALVEAERHLCRRALELQRRAVALGQQDRGEWQRQWPRAQGTSMNARCGAGWKIRSSP